METQKKNKFYIFFRKFQILLFYFFYEFSSHLKTNFIHSSIILFNSCSSSLLNHSQTKFFQLIFETKFSSFSSEEKGSRSDLKKYEERSRYKLCRASFSNSEPLEHGDFPF